MKKLTTILCLTLPVGRLKNELGHNAISGVTRREKQGAIRMKTELEMIHLIVLSWLYFFSHFLRKTSADSLKRHNT